MGPRCLLGRNPSCDIRIDNRRVSGEHASIHYNGNHWELRDLRSTNGTHFGTRRIEREVLSLGTQFSVGGVIFELIDADPPVAGARHIASGVARHAEAGLLMLPDQDHPIATIYEGTNGLWTLESQNEQRQVVDRDVVVIGGERWEIEIPDPSIATLDTARFGLMLEAITLRFTVSRDEERVELTLVHDGGEIRLGTRKYFYILLMLARAWLEDERSSPAERGWVEREWLCRQLDVEAGKLNVDIHRARGQLSARNVHGAAGLVERRVDSGKLRIGVPRVEVIVQKVFVDEERLSGEVLSGESLRREPWPDSMSETLGDASIDHPGEAKTDPAIEAPHDWPAVDPAANSEGRPTLPSALLADSFDEGRRKG